MSKSTLNRELIILRHAKSDWNASIANDFDRPLNQRGSLDAPRMGQWMHDQHLHPDLILCSPAHRAKSTMLAVLDQLSLAPTLVRWEEEIYEAATSTLVQLISNIPDKIKRVLLVGHNPGLESLAQYLTNNSDSLPYGCMKTATLVQLDITCHWADLQPGSGKFMQLMSPKKLPDKYA